MIATNLDELYERYIKPLPTSERLRLVAMISDGIADASVHLERSLLELEGLGQEIWEGVDAQRYVDDLRDECGRHP